jgi:hypothetical protein
LSAIRGVEQPLVRAWFPSPRSTGSERCAPINRASRQLDRLPRTLCHLDLHRNLFADGDDCTVAVDWSFVGIGAIGEDAGNLVADAVLDFHVDPPGSMSSTSGSCAVRRGLRDAGATCRRRRWRIAAAIAAATRIAGDPARSVEGRELLNRRPIEETLRWAPTVDFLLDRGRRAARFYCDRLDSAVGTATASAQRWNVGCRATRRRRRGRSGVVAGSWGGATVRRTALAGEVHLVERTDLDAVDGVGPHPRGIDVLVQVEDRRPAVAALHDCALQRAVRSIQAFDMHERSTSIFMGQPCT